MERTMDEGSAPEYVTPTPGFGDHVARPMARRTWAILGTVNADGSPQVAPVMFLFEDGQVFLTTEGRTRKAVNLRERPRATVLVETEGRLGWVKANGTAHLVEGDAAAPILHRINSKYMTERGAESYQDVSFDDTAIVVTPTSWSSWSIEKLLPGYEAKGYDAGTVMAEFKPLDP